MSDSAKPEAEATAGVGGAGKPGGNVDPKLSEGSDDEPRRPRRKKVTRESVHSVPRGPMYDFKRSDDEREKLMEDLKVEAGVEKGHALDLPKIDDKIKKLRNRAYGVGSKVSNSLQIYLSDRNEFSIDRIIGDLQDIGLFDLFGPIPDGERSERDRIRCANELWVRTQILGKLSGKNTVALLLSQRVAPRMRDLRKVCDDLHNIRAQTSVAYQLLRCLSAVLSGLAVLVAAVQASIGDFFNGFFNASSDDSEESAASEQQAVTTFSLTIVGGILSALNLILVTSWPLEESRSKLDKVSNCRHTAKKQVLRLQTHFDALRSMKLNERDIRDIQKEIFSPEWLQSENEVKVTAENYLAKPHKDAWLAGAVKDFERWSNNKKVDLQAEKDKLKTEAKNKKDQYKEACKKAKNSLCKCCAERLCRQLHRVACAACCACWAASCRLKQVTRELDILDPGQGGNAAVEGGNAAVEDGNPGPDAERGQAKSWCCQKNADVQ